MIQQLLFTNKSIDTNLQLQFSQQQLDPQKSSLANPQKVLASLDIFDTNMMANWHSVFDLLLLVQEKVTRKNPMPGWHSGLMLWLSSMLTL